MMNSPLLKPALVFEVNPVPILRGLYYRVSYNAG